ncbi:MAG: hypothetical protein A3J55_02380 [Candidatus Ryanbacteria bacterium RIFCSPHIGHO2_02_FULL_45_17b]|uniref:DUF8173 domain-containing protein n=1 Tax=Candidatus Ryanbacteria bacterium RIFCSPHIGHO2_01_FULL_45_22 TaxID=1802114 RepID=A0A1G2G042_9BACT|nr:MAG: hypothetical protein A2719_00820 [Candidatus Ryanbacteria bacterium RIFCSPHIGHO2_01_FULL_45_22]OGZ46777.1 MAG: hypothetical protein A3J55_02380 [Candidatus Ryanbacteria bacterium RIFCSPHIGHO2_02_FULL_45_17b]
MRKNIFLVLSFLVLPGLVLAAEFRGGEHVSLNIAERVTNDVYLGGSSVSSAGIVTGDVIAGGGQVLISGDVSGDVLVGGGNVTILSHVGDDVRAGGGTVLLQARIDGDAIIGGGQVTLGGEGVGGDAVVGGGVVQIDAPVSGSVRVAGGDVYINAPIAGDVTVKADMLTLGRNAVISGNLFYKATKELTQEDGAVVRGRVDFQQRERKDVPRALVGAFISIAMIGRFLMLLFSSLLVGLSFRRFGKKFIDTASANMLGELGKGLVVCIATPIISSVLFVTIIGIPLGVLGLLGFVMLVLATWIVTPLLVGNMFFQYVLKKESGVSWQTITVGTVVFSMLGLVPFIGWLAQIILLVISLGAVCSTKWDIVKEWK